MPHFIFFGPVHWTRPRMIQRYRPVVHEDIRFPKLCWRYSDILDRPVLTRVPPHVGIGPLLQSISNLEHFTKCCDSKKRRKIPHFFNIYVTCMFLKFRTDYLLFYWTILDHATQFINLTRLSHTFVVRIWFFSSWNRTTEVAAKRSNI